MFNLHCYLGQRIALLSATAILMIGFNWAQEPSSETVNGQLKNLYLQHDLRIRQQLPPYSGMPPLLDLTGRNLSDGVCDNYQFYKNNSWEEQFKYMEGGQVITDPGISKLSEATSISMTTIDGVGPVNALPAKSSSLVLIARPISDRVCISQDRRLVYLRFRLKILQRLKPDGVAHQDNEFFEAIQLGGNILFPSGHLATYLLANRGFLAIDEKYIVFFRRPRAKSDSLMVSQAYLVKDGLIFPVSATAPNAVHYTGMPMKSFQTRVEAAIAKNVDVDWQP